MDNSLGSAIDKIKEQEQNKEIKLKAKREFEATKVAVERSLREVISHAKKLQQERYQLLKKTDQLRTQCTIQKTHKDALVAQLVASRREFEELQAKADRVMNEIREHRSSYCKAVQEISDDCDVWALLRRPTSTELVSRPVKKVPENNEQALANEQRLIAAVEKREKAVAERDRLLAEPDVGAEFDKKCSSLFFGDNCQSTKTNWLRKFCKLNYPIRFYCNKGEVNENEPIKFSTSAAAQKRVKPLVRKPDINQMPWYQPYIVVGSVTVFLLYFCVFREESDVDQEFTKTLYERIKGLEKEQLLQTYKFNKEHGKELFEIEQRLKEIEEEEKSKSSV